MTPAIFQGNEELRKRLIAAEDILNLAFQAADFAEDERVALSTDANVYRDGTEHAGRVAILRYKRAIEALKSPSIQSQGPITPNYKGEDAYEALALEQKPL